MDLGVHCIELIEQVLDDEIENVKAIYSTNTFSYEVEDSAVIAFTTKNCVLGHIDVNFNIPDDASESKLEVYGTEGYAICYGTLGQEEAGTLKYLYSPQGSYSAMQHRHTPEPTVYTAQGGNLYLKHIKEFRLQAQSGIIDNSGARKAVHVQEIIDKIYFFAFK